MIPNSWLKQFLQSKRETFQWFEWSMATECDARNPRSESKSRIFTRECQSNNNDAKPGCKSKMKLNFTIFVRNSASGILNQKNRSDPLQYL